MNYTHHKESVDVLMMVVGGVIHGAIKMPTLYTLKFRIFVLHTINFGDLRTSL